MNQFSLIGFLILAVVVATFSVQNSGEAVVKFIWWQFQSSLVVMILISTALGAIMAIFLSSPEPSGCACDCGSSRNTSLSWNSDSGNVKQPGPGIRQTLGNRSGMR